MSTSVISLINVSKIRLQNGTKKQQHFITHASRSLVWIRFVAVAFQSEEFFFKKETPHPPPPPPTLTPVTYFASPWIRHWVDRAQNIFMHVPGHEHFIPTKFRKHPLSVSVVKAGYVFPYIYMHLVPPPPFHLNKFIENSLKFLKHLNLLYKHSSNYKHGNYTK